MIRIHLNCGHGRLIDPTSHEADEILRTQTAACKTCPVQFGEQRYEGITTDADAKYGLPDSLKRLTEARASQPQPRTAIPEGSRGMPHIEIPQTADYDRNSRSADEPCIRCGRQTAANLFVHMTVEGLFAPADEQVDENLDQGWFPIGPDCAKTIAAGYTRGW